MISALLSFLGGSAFRLIWGEIAAFLTAKQEHAHELDRLRLQGDLEAAAHARNLEAIRVQAELGVKTIEVQGNADLAKIDASAWAQAVADIGKQTGIRFVDIWNGVIRPLLASLAILIVVGEVVRSGFVLSDWHKDLVGAILGMYVADRTLAKRNK